MRKKRMKLKIKSLKNIVQSSFTFIAIVPLLIYITLNSLIIFNNFNSLENTNMKERIQYANKIFISKNVELKKIATDYGVWDETYNSTLEKNSDWFKENISGWIPENFNIEFVIVSNKNFEVVDKYGIDDSSALQILKNDVFTKVVNGKFDKNSNLPMGFIKYGDDLYLLGISPVMQSFYKGTSEGVLILGKKVTSSFLEDISKSFGFNTFLYLGDIAVSRSEDSKDIDKYIELYNKNKLEDAFIIDKNTIMSKKTIKDISNNEIGYLFLIESRQTFTSTLSLIIKNGVIALFLILCITLLLSNHLRKVIIKPIVNLESQIGKIIDNNKLEQVNTEGPSEIMNVVDIFNQLITNLLGQKRENERLRKLALKDSETNFYNDKHFFEYFQKKITEDSRSIIILFGQIDNFDLYQQMIDESKLNSILRKISNIMLTTIEGNEISDESVSRYEEDKIVILLDNYTVNQATAIAERIIVDIRNHYPLQKQALNFPITISFGLASYPADGLNVRDVINNAEKALEISKSKGGNSWVVYEKNINTSIKE